MNALDRNRQHMLSAVHKVVQDYRNVWETIPNFLDPFQRLEDYFKQFDELQRERLELTTSIVDARNEDWQSFAVNCQQLSGFLLAKAREKGAMELTTFLVESGSALNRRNYNQALNRAQRLLEIANEWAEESDSDQEKAVHQLAEQKILRFAQFGMSPLERRQRSSEILQHLRELYSEISRFFKLELDPLMSFFKTEGRAFYVAYKKARRIHQYNSARMMSSNGGSNMASAQGGGADSTDAGPPGGSSGNTADAA